MKKSLILLILLSLVILPACRYAHGDGPDVATPRKQETGKNPRKASWLKDQMNRERIGRTDINTTGINDDFQVFPHREGKRRSESLRSSSSTFFWR